MEILGMKKIMATGNVGDMVISTYAEMQGLVHARKMQKKRYISLRLTGAPRPVRALPRSSLPPSLAPDYSEARSGKYIAFFACNYVGIVTRANQLT